MTARGLFADNWGLKLVSLLCASLVWLFVVGQEQREEYFKVRLVLTNTPEDLVIVSRVPEYIGVRLVGSRSILSNVRARMLSVSLDLDGMQEGVSSFEILPARLGLPLTFYSPEELSAVEVPNPSPAVVKHMGVASVCEAAALLAAMSRRLLISKHKSPNVTLAVALLSPGGGSTS